MKTLTVILLALIFYSCNTSKKALLKTIESYSIKGEAEDSVFCRLQKSNDLIIGYYTHSTAWEHGTVCRLFVLNGRNWTAYKYVIQSYITIGQKPYTLDSFAIPQKYGDSSFSIFKKAKSWELRTNKHEDGNECPHMDPKKHPGCGIYDADDEWLAIITKTHNNGVKFYAPEYYEYECCPGWKDRKRYLETVAPIKAFFKKLQNSGNR